jgi:hypothetical protein
MARGLRDILLRAGIFSEPGLESAALLAHLQAISEIML